MVRRQAHKKEKQEGVLIVIDFLKDKVQNINVVKEFTTKVQDSVL
jgi:hypothetical protein